MFQGFRAAGSIAAVLALVIAGCGSRPVFEVGEVQGTVTLNGKPLIGAIVTFYPEFDINSPLPFATGVTDQNGVYTLAIDKNTSGAVVGRNVAVVCWPVRDRGAPPVVTDVPIPLKYTVPGDSPLKVDVKAEKGQVIDLKLTWN